MNSVRPLVIAALAAGCAAAALLILSGSGTSGLKPDVLDTLGVAQPAEQIRIYPQKKGQEFVRSSDYLRAADLGGRPFSRFEKTDGGVIDTYYRLNRSKEYVLEYFPAPVGNPKPLKSALIYASDGDQLVGEVRFGDNAVRLLRAVRLPNGNYQTSSYFPDGLTIASVKEEGQGPQKYDHSPKVLHEKRWTKTASGLMLSYESVLNDDNSRTVTNFDDQGFPVQVSKLTEYGPGSTVSGYYPGTKQVRLESTTTWNETSVRMLRRDGTLDRTAVITSGMVKMVYYDLSGKNVLLTQSWLFTRNTVDGVVRMKNIRIYQVIEPDGHGGDGRTWIWLVENMASLKMWSYEEHNVLWPYTTQPIACKSYLTYLNEDTGVGEKSVCTLADDKLPNLERVYTVADAVRAPDVPAADLVAFQLDENLPIPQEMSYGGH